ncbi:MAG: rhodanese-related sulfurtransferase [Rhodobacteraceae bacterium]|nr:rhodanese-related sulfurtransferase [Paracoccaceae bacterium]
MTNTLIAAFYHFADVADPTALIETLRRAGEAADVAGSLLVAPEGINGTLAGAPTSLRGFLEGVRADPRFAALRWKESWSEDPPFLRLKVRLKREIVSMGAPGVVSPETVGEYVPPEEWNALIADPDVAVIDVRNGYETALGQFDGALDPETGSFRDFPAWVAANAPMLREKRAIAAYCTGGIRCEKATVLLRELGLPEVKHLEGGILGYLEHVPVERSKWRGECFVFDDRVSVDHNLRPGAHELCHGCRRAISAADKQDPRYIPSVSCPHCAAEMTPQQEARRAERARQSRLAAERGERHLGARQGKPARSD